MPRGMQESAGRLRAKDATCLYVPCELASPNPSPGRVALELHEAHRLAGERARPCSPWKAMMTSFLR